ncbi:MAG: imidazole glycerol phosphate synthase subunit HisH [Spirochaetales bacterium]
MITGILDYDAGNLTSVQNALDHLGEKWLVSSDPAALARADRLLVPGDGHAQTCMENLRSQGLDQLLADFLQQGRPILGICVGSQIVLERSDEGPCACLGLVPGSCHRLPGGGGLKVPHMGWNEVSLTDPAHPLVRGIPNRSSFYFVHSFYTAPAPGVSVLGTTDHGISFTVGFVHGSLATWQFHPEKSGPVGLKLVENFLKWRP